MTYFSQMFAALFGRILGTIKAKDEVCLGEQIG
jgi:hypothetical protein